MEQDKNAHKKDMVKGFKKKSDATVYSYDKDGKVKKDEELKQNDPNHETPTNVEELSDEDFARRFPDIA